MTVPRAAASQLAGRFSPLLLIWGLCAVYTLAHVDRGWVPHDEGLLAQTAERVLQGELPHRDFDDTYTGGLAYLHALGLAVFGTNLLSLRVVLFLFFLGWVPVLYSVASRFARPPVAALTVLLAVAWSVPQYPAAIPSWYNLFFATFGIAALLRYLEQPAPRWLFLAGLCGGLSFLVKITGLFYLAGALAFLVFHEQTVAAGAGEGPARDAPVYRLALGIGAATVVAVLVALVWSRGPRELWYSVTPPAVVAGVLLWHEGVARSSGSWERFARLAGLAAPFIAGAALPLVLFAIPYVASGALTDLLAGVFQIPSRRFGQAVILPPPVLLSLFTGLPLVLFLQTAVGPRSWTDLERLLVVVFLGITLLGATKQAGMYQLVWHSARALVPLGVLAAALALVRARQSALGRQQLLLLLAMTALGSLVQLPFSASVYFCYVAPLAVLTAVAVLAAAGRPSAFAPTAAGVFYLAFAVLLTNRSTVYDLGVRYPRDPRVERLQLARGGIRVPPGEKAMYEQVVALVTEHARSDVIYATPDCPQIYFLSGKRNPTRHLFEFLRHTDVELMTGNVVDLLLREGVNVLVLNGRPEFSGQLTGEARAAFAKHFPDSATVGHFTVRWRS